MSINRYDSLQSKTLIDGPIHVVSSPWVVSSAEQITYNAPATDDIDNSICSVNIENDPITIDTSHTSKNIETDKHTDFTFSSKGLNFQI